MIWDAQFCGYDEAIVDLPNSTTDQDIKKMFESVLGIQYDSNCRYEIKNDI